MGTYCFLNNLNEYDTCGYQYTSTNLEYAIARKYRKRKFSFYIKCIKWLWNNRKWDNTRQKFKAMEKECGFGSTGL